MAHGAEQTRARIQHQISERNGHFYEAEAEKLDDWADDLKLTLEREIKDFDRKLKEARRAAKASLTLEDKLAGQKQLKSIESARAQKRRSLFDAQDEIDHKRNSSSPTSRVSWLRTPRSPRSSRSGGD